MKKLITMIILLITAVVLLSILGCSRDEEILGYSEEFPYVVDWVDSLPEFGLKK